MNGEAREDILIEVSLLAIETEAAAKDVVKELRKAAGKVRKYLKENSE